MIIEQLTITDATGKKYKYSFDKKTMIYSKENSKGKTTLIRFILYSLGYQIPATEGIGSFDYFCFELDIINKDNRYKIYRKINELCILYNEKKYNFILPMDENKVHLMIFGINNITILNNLLAVFYIDQEKGWTLLNRGKIIGNNRFNIEEFVAGISNINIDDLLEEKKVLNNEIKKYRYFKNVIDINSEFDDEEDYIYTYDKYNMDELIQEKKEIDIKLKKIHNNINELELIIKTNNGFANMIENYGLIVSHNGEEFVLTRKELSNFDISQDMLRIKLNSYKMEEIKLKKQINIINKNINEKNILFTTGSLLDDMQHSLENVSIDLAQIDKILKQLTYKRNVINSKIKDQLSFNNIQLSEFYEIILKYSKILEIDNFISEQSSKFVLTNKLKGLSGRVLAQFSFVFKLSYIKAIEKKYDFLLPIIIDSPRTNELSEKSTNDMINILKNDFSNHQIITASIYENNIIDFSLVNLNDGLMSKSFEIND